MPKRSRSEILDVDDIIDSINLDKGIRAGLEELTVDELTAVLADLAKSANFPTAGLQETEPNLPSFSTAKWSDISRGLGLPSTPSRVILEPFQTPKYRLPLSLHETMFENAWRWHDVYRERSAQTREAARVRLLEPYIIPLIALFQGRVIDAPEEAMMATKYSSGGGVEHDILMIGGFMFLVIEFKLGMPKEHDLAQLFLELLSAAEMNSELSFKGLCVYGLLTDLIEFAFYLYDPCEKKFCMDEIIMINITRIHRFSNMINVSNKLFSVLLSAYVDGLQAMTARSKDRAKNNGVWEAALDWTVQCISKFEELPASLQDIEDNANAALEFLATSVCSIPRVSRFTGEENDPSNLAELKELAVKVVKEEHVCFLAKLKV